MLSNKVVDMEGKKVQSFREWAAAGGLNTVRTEIESGTEAPEVLMPGSPLLKNTTTEAKKTASDQMWDRGSQPSISTRTQAKRKAESAKKAYDDYTQSAEYKVKKAEQEKQKTIQKLLTGIVDVNPIPEEADEKEQQLKAERDYWQSQYEAEENQKVMDADLAELESWSDEDRRALEQYAVGRTTDYFGALNGIQSGKAEQQAAGLIQKYGQKRVDELAETWNRNQNRETSEEVTAKAQEGAGSGVLGAVGHSAASVGASTVGGISGVLDYIRELSQRSGRYSTLDPNAAGNLGNVYSSAVRGTVAQNIEEDNGVLGKIGSIAYQGVMSAAESIARGYLGGGAFGGAALAATNTFSQTMADASKQGASPAQAALLATSNAAIEALSEKIPLDNLIDTAKGGTQTVKQILKTLLIQAGIEATTEEISLVGNLLAEAAILREKSSYNQTINELVANGETPEAAKQQVSVDVLKEAVKTFLVSGFSGGISSAGAVYSAARNDAKDAAQNKIQKDSQIYNWGIKKDAPLGGAQPVVSNSSRDTSSGASVDTTLGGVRDDSTNRKPYDASSVVSNNSIQQTAPEVNQNQPEMQSTPTTDTQKQSAQSGQQTETAPEQPQMQRDRVNSVREQQIPVTDQAGKIVSEAAGNIYTSARTPDSFAETIRRLVNEGKVSHDVQTNEESLRKAAASIAEDGSLRKALDSIKKIADSGRTGALDVAKGVLIYDELVNSNDPGLQPLAEDCFVTLSQLATNTGRPMQLFSLFRKMSPESQVNVLKNEVSRELQKLQKRGTVKKDYQLQFDQELMDKYKNAAEAYQKATDAKTKKAAEEAMQHIQQAVYSWEAAKMPTTFKARWDAWRYMAMLGNVKTQLRNVAGNALMMPYTDVKRKVGALLEKGVSQDQRTKAVFQDKELLKLAREDLKNAPVVNALKNSAKLGDDVKTSLADDIKTFGDSWLGERFNDLQSAIDAAVSGGDMFYKNREYAQSLAGFLKARGYTAADVQNELVSQDVMNEARNYAINEALRATFNDTNVLSDALSSLRYNGDNKVLKVINTLGEGLMPFRKTPANVVMRFKDYSPVGLTQGLWNMAANVRNGKVSAATAIDQISAGLTGTGAMMLGYALAGGIAGVKLTGSGTDEDEKRQGHQDYALEFSINGEEYSYKIDWASPFNLPLFLGANLRALMESEDTASGLTALMNVGMGALEPLLELSCMSSMNDFFEGIRYADEGEALYTAIANVATSYFTQGVPSLARQATQAATEYKQTTFVTSDDPVIQKGQKALTGTGVGNAYKTDKVNAWGEKEKQSDALSGLFEGIFGEKAGSTVARAIDAFFNPGTLKKIDNSALEQEIARLNKAGQNVTPDTASKTISYIDKDGTRHDDVRLTEEQYQTLAQTQGQTAKRIIEAMIVSKDYAAMTDAQKAAAIDQAYLYARKTGEISAIKDHAGYSDSWMIGIEGKESKTILRRVMNSELNSAMSDLDTAWDKGYDEETFSRELQTAYDTYSKATSTMKKQVYEEASGTTKKYIEARDKGISHEDFVSAAENVAKVKGTGSNGTVRDIDRQQAIANTTGLAEEEVDVIMKCYMGDYDPSDESPETTEFKYEYVRQQLGLSAEEYAATYRAYLDEDRKNDKIAAIRELGFDYKTASKLYQVYYGGMKDNLIDMYG